MSSTIIPVPFMGSARLYVIFSRDFTTTEIHTLSLHDALPIYRDTLGVFFLEAMLGDQAREERAIDAPCQDRKSTRLNSSHSQISYAVFCLKKKTSLNFIYTYANKWLKSFCTCLKSIINYYV